MLFVHGFSRAGQHAGDGDAEDNTEGHLTHGTPGLDAARPPSSGTGAVSSGWTPSALGPGVAICYLPQQVATGITTPLCLCLASERASFQVAGIGIDKQHFRCQQSKHCATFHGGDGIPFGYLPVSGNEAVNCTFWHSTVAQAGSELVSEHNLQIPMTRASQYMQRRDLCSKGTRPFTTSHEQMVAFFFLRGDCMSPSLGDLGQGEYLVLSPEPLGMSIVIPRRRGPPTLR